MAQDTISLPTVQQGMGVCQDREDSSGGRCLCRLAALESEQAHKVSFRCAHVKFYCELESMCPLNFCLLRLRYQRQLTYFL